jgi:flagellar protein FlaF
MGTTGFPTLVTALHSNRCLWNVLAVDVADSGNELSKAVRAQIFYLSEFVREHTKKILAGDATVDALVDVNLAIMRGLNAEGE